MRKIKNLVKGLYKNMSYLKYYLYRPILPQKNEPPKIVVSFTTYPARLHCLPMVVGSILRQTMQPDKIVLYLSAEQFENFEHPILQMIMKQGVTLRMVDGDIRSHKKYYYAMQEFPESVIITIDDDIIYDKNTINELYLSYTKHPKAVSAKRVHGMLFDKNCNLLAYNQWQYEKRDCIDIEMYDLIPTGCGGVLYPPHCLDTRVFDKSGIENTCLYADDLWLKIMALLNDTPTVLAKSNNYNLKNVWGTLNDGLASSNVLECKNDYQMNNIIKYLDIDIFDLVHQKSKRL